MATDAIPTEIKLSMYDAWTEEIREHHRRILVARAYHDGNQPLALTDRQKKFLALHPDSRFCLNVCRIVVTALSDELIVTGFDTNEKADANGVKKQAEFYAKVWAENKMDQSQSEVHEWAIRDSESFLILDWDDEKKLPVMVLHEAWTDEQVNAWENSEANASADMVNDAQGTGAGVYVKYINNDVTQPIEYAIQYFYADEYDANGDVVQVHRRTIYKSDKIIRQRVGDDGKWTEHEPEKPWKTTDGKPIGVPVIPFVNKGQRQEAWDALPPQDAVNKTYADLLASSDFFGFPIAWIFGMYPTTDGKVPAEDGSNLIYFQPGQMNGNANKKADEVKVEKWEGSDPTPLMNTLKDQIMFIAQITGTPVNKFITTAQVASAETLKEQRDSLKTRARNRQTAFGDSWETAMKMARRIFNAFNRGESLDETVTVETVWKIIETIDELKEHQGFGVPQEVLWSRLGYSPEKITEIKNTPAYRIQFLKSFYEAYGSASVNGITVQEFARAVGMSAEEIKMLTPGESVPPTEV